MSDEERKDEQQTDQKTEKTGGDAIVETVIGLAVLGLGAAVVSGSMSLGGVLRGLTRGTPPRTPPIAPL